MKKPLLLLTAAAYCFLHTFFSSAQEIEWQKSIGGTDGDAVYSIQQTSDGGYIVAGNTWSNDGDVSGNHGTTDFWVVKINSNGNIQWQKCLGGTGDDIAYSIQQTSDGGYIAGGKTRSNNGDVSGNHGGADYWVVKTDSSGNIQWQKCLGGTDNEQAGSIHQTNDNGYVMVGWTYSNDGDVSGNNDIINGNYWIVRLDSSGAIQWQKCIGGTSADYVWSIQQTNDNRFILAGSTNSFDGDVSGNHGSWDWWIVKLDDSGNIQWQKCLGGTSSDFAYSIQQTADSGYVVVGYASSINGDVSGNHGGNDYWVVKLDSIGSIQWQKCLGGTNDETANSILQTSDGGYITTGSTLSNDGDVSGNHGSGDYWSVKLDSSGNIQWQKCMGSVGGDYANVNAIQQTSDGGFCLGGRTESNNGDVTGNHGNSDGWIIKLTDKYNSISGKLFIDSNSNMMHDAGEASITNNKITELNTGKFSFSQSMGFYYLNILDTGNFLVVSNLNYHNAVPISHNAYFSGFQQTDSLNDFAFQPAGVFNDLCIKITPLGNFRAGFNASYMINYENVGTTTLNPTIIFFPDTSVTYVSSVPSASSVTTDSIVWNFGPLAPFQTGNILVTVNVNLGTPIGTLINSGVEIDPVAGDANTACNYHAWEVFTTGAVDPNDIIVDEDTLWTTQFPNPPYLEYIIRFQNTGNDTAFNARVLNNIPQRLDVNTFEFVSASHPVNITYGAHSRLFTFTFDNILLPDSNVNEPASHGFIRYRIKPKSNLVAGNKIYNKAFIYFDFNQPVETNNAVTEIVLPTGVPQLTGINGQLAIYPNPANELLVINYPLSDNDKIRVTDITGRVLFAKTIPSPTLTFRLQTLNYSAGVYFVEIITGKEKLVRKMVKQ